MNYTTQFIQTQPFTEVILRADAYSTEPFKQRITLIVPKQSSKLGSMRISQLIHLPTLIATIWFGLIFLLFFSYYLSAYQYNYHQNNGIIYRTHKTSGITEYQWPNSNEWKALPRKPVSPKLRAEGIK